MRHLATKRQSFVRRRQFGGVHEAVPAAAPKPAPTLVEYRDDRPALNAYPTRIISPSRPSACCADGMALLGAPQRDGAWEYYYKRCGTCGYTVRFYTSQGLDAILDELKGLFDAPEARWLPEVGEPEPAAA